MRGDAKTAARLSEQVAKENRAFDNALVFTMWRQRDNVEAHKLGNAESLDEAKADASNSLQHKDKLFIRESHAGTNKHILHCHLVRQGQRTYRRNPQTGLSEAYKPLKLDLIFSLPVSSFEPKRPFDAFLDPASGIDPSLVEVADNIEECDRRLARMLGESGS